MNGIPYTVIGVMKPKEQNSSYDGADVRKIFIPFNAMRRDFPNKPPAPEHSVDRLACGAMVARYPCRLREADSPLTGPAA